MVAQGREDGDRTVLRKMTGKQGLNKWNAPNPLSDAQLSDRVYEAIKEGGWTFSRLYYQLRSEGFSVGLPRVRKMWIEEGGEMGAYYPFR